MMKWAPLRAWDDLPRFDTTSASLFGQLYILFCQLSPAECLVLCRSYGASGEELASIGADINQPMESQMRNPQPPARQQRQQQRKPNDLSYCLMALDRDQTLIAVVELSLSSWLVAGVVPGVERQPLKKLKPEPGLLFEILHRWRLEAKRSGQARDAAHCGHCAHVRRLQAAIQPAQG
jgi:transposase